MTRREHGSGAASRPRVPADCGREDDGVEVRRGRPEAPVTEDAAPVDRDDRIGPAERDGRTPGEVPAVQTATTVSGWGGMAISAGGARSNCPSQGPNSLCTSG